MKKILLSISACLLLGVSINAQTNKDSSTLQIAGSADLYYKYDLSSSDKNSPPTDYPVSTVNTKLNTLDFGLLDVILKKKIQNTSILADVTFGSRFDTKSQLAGQPGSNYRIQNLYLTYDITNALSVSAGAMFKFQSFEKMVPASNFNYSMSKTFLLNINNSYQRGGGVRAEYVFSPKVKLQVGFYNTQTAKSSADAIASYYLYRVADFSTQLFVNPTKDLSLSAAFWREGSENNGLHYNLQAIYQASKSVKLGFDGTIFSASDTIDIDGLTRGPKTFKSAVFYAQKSINKIFTIGARYEYLAQTSQVMANNSFPDVYFNTFTLTNNIKLGNLVLKQEFVVEGTNKGNNDPNWNPYLDKNGNMAHGTKEIVLAAVYNF